MFWWFFPNMSKHVFKWFHILGWISDKLVLRKAWNVNFNIPIIVPLENLLMDLIGFFNFIFLFSFNRPDSDHPITDPLHKPDPFLFFFDYIFNSLLGKAHIKHTFNSLIILISNLLDFDFQYLFNIFIR